MNASLIKPLATSLTGCALALAALGFGSASFGQPAAVGAAASSDLPPVAVVFGAPLVCPEVIAPSTVAAVLTSMDDMGAKPLPIHIAQAREAMSHTGNAVKAPVGEEAQQAAAQVSWLMLRGSVVSAKMLNDALSKTPGFAEFSAAMEAHLTVVTQPVQSNDDIANEFEPPRRIVIPPETKLAPSSDLMPASASLREIIRRAGTSRVAMGELYREPAIRYYLLSQGFGDTVGVLASRHGVCALKLSSTEIEKLNVSARYMAMPARAGMPGPHGVTVPPIR